MAYVNVLAHIVVSLVVFASCMPYISISFGTILLGENLDFWDESAADGPSKLCHLEYNQTLGSNEGYHPYNIPYNTYSVNFFLDKLEVGGLASYCLVSTYN